MKLTQDERDELERARPIVEALLRYGNASRNISKLQACRKVGPRRKDPAYQESRKERGEAFNAVQRIAVRLSQDAERQSEGRLT